MARVDLNMSDAALPRLNQARWANTLQLGRTYLLALRINEALPEVMGSFADKVASNGLTP